MYDVYLSTQGRALDAMKWAKALNLSPKEQLEYITAEMNTVARHAYHAGRQGSTLVVDSRDGQKTEVVK